MNYDAKNHYAYLLIGSMKNSYDKNLDSTFDINEFDLRNLKLSVDNVLNNINVKQLLIILNFIEETTYQFILKKDRLPTYREMRRMFSQKNKGC